MRRTLRMLCVGAMAAFSAISFAQTNVTSKLRNADMERGVLGWDITFEGTDLWKKTTKNQSSQPSYYGMDNACLEVWKSNAEPVANNSISQTLKNLPNGTYVFGAYMVACDQSKEETRELIEGVSIFANEMATPVATNSAQGMDTLWAHTSKFNVAATVTDGTLKVGVDVVETSASFVLIDNATLYYFGDMEPAVALDEMAKIDIAAMLAIADTCLTNKMDGEVLAALNEAIEGAKALTTDAELYTAIENLGWGIRKAVESIKIYTKLGKALKAAHEVATQEWTQYVEEALDALMALIDEVQAMYDEGNVSREEVNILVANLEEAAAVVKLDEVYVNLDLYTERVDELPIGDAVGEYTDDKYDECQAYLGEINILLSEVEEGTTSATVAMNSCAQLFGKIDNVIENPNTLDEFPILLPRDTQALNNMKVLKGSTLNSNGLATYKSKTFTFDYPLTKLRFIVKESGSNSLQNGYPFVALSDFTMFDADGEIIELTTEMVTSNADHNVINNARDGAGIAGLLDGDLGTYFHSAYKNGPADYHYIEVTLPEDTYYAFSFSISARSNSEFHTGQFPAVLEIVHLSEADANLRAIVNTAKGLKPYQGTDPGFFNVDIAPFKEALAAAEALIDAEASESEIIAATEALETEYANLMEVGIAMPDPEKKYRIVSAYADFFKHQNVQKAMTVGHDGHLWWEDANPDSLKQEFYLEARGNGYVIRSAADGTYANRTGGNYKMLESATDSLMLISLGKGEFGLKYPQESTVLHPCDHNSGKLGAGWNGSIYGTGGGIFGEGSRISSWGSASAGTVTSWYIRELTALPSAQKSISDLDFETATLHLYEGVNTLSFTADKACAFENFAMYDLLGAEIPFTITVNGAVATVIVDAIAIETFSFAFTNTEGVSTVTVDGFITSLAVLHEAYNNALAVAPVESDEIGKIGDLSEYNAALEAAEELLATGGTDEAVQQAVAALDSAVAHLNNYINYPDPDKTYFVISAYSEYQRLQGVDMALYTKFDALTWSYSNVTNNTYRWRFVEAEPATDGKPAYYIQNAGTDLYIGTAEANSIELVMVDNREETEPYSICLHNGVSVTLTKRNSGNLNFHLKNHSSGAGAYGPVIYWSTTEAASDFRIVESEMYIDEYLKELGVEHIDMADEYVAPAVKGTFDLFGRRIDTPATTGVYIVDGKKCVIKK